MLAVGAVAPDFSATLDDGTPFKLSEFRGKQNVVLYFYPKDFTPGCTKEACSFRDNYAEIAAYDAVIYGVSGDSTDSHARFRETHSLPFPLIPDPGKEIIRLYEAKGTFGLMTARATYVIDKTGVIRAAIRHDFRVSEHVPEVLAALEAFQPRAQAATPE